MNSVEIKKINFRLKTLIIGISMIICHTLTQAQTSIDSKDKPSINREVTFKIVTYTDDGELVVEPSAAEVRSDAVDLKYTFRYFVVWKQEEGVWKLYRDVTL